MIQVSELGGALFISGITDKFSRDISIINTTFQNCSTGQSGGAIFLCYEEGNITLTVKRSRFLDNLSFQNSGGTILLSLPPEIQDVRLTVTTMLMKNTHRGLRKVMWFLKILLFIEMVQDLVVLSI